jgi:phospholipid/cholesterol/gamma-HCH transport system substrate-binding protein
MKASTKLEYKVGLFIAAGALLFMATVLMLGADKTLFTRYVHIKARFTEVNGLFPGSVVSLAGVPVGNVQAIVFVNGENKLELDLKIDRAFQPRLTDGMIAEVRTQGALGDKYVFLNPGPLTAKQLDDGALVPANEQDIMKLLTSREDGVAKIIDVIKELDILLASINQNGKMGQTIANLSDASGKLKSTLGQLDVVLQDIHGEIPQNHKVRTALLNLSSILEKIDSGKGTLGALINDPSIAQSLKGMLGGSPRNKYVKDMLRETLQQSGASK